MAIPGDMEGGRRPKGAFANADSVADRAHTYESRAGAVLDMDSCLDSCMMHYILYMSSYISHYIDPYISPYILMKAAVCATSVDPGKSSTYL